MEGRKEFEEESSNDELTENELARDEVNEEPQEQEEMAQESQGQRQSYLYSTGATLFQPSFQLESGTYQNEFPSSFRAKK